jgi:hypothetical protein
MSDTPKYSQAELDRQRQQKLEAERREAEQRAAEARRRAEAEAAKKRLENLRQRTHKNLEAVSQKIAQQQPHAYAEDLEQLKNLCQKQIEITSRASSEGELHKVAKELTHLEAELDRAVDRKRRDDEEKKRKDEIQKQQFSLDELQRQLGRVGAADAAKFDANGRAQADQALQAVKKAIASGKPTAVIAPLATATKAVSQHIQQVRDRLTEWERRKAEAEAVEGELLAFLVALQADQVFMRWQGYRWAELQAYVTKAKAAIASEQFEQVADILNALRSQSSQMLAEASAAQLKADQRDYIVNSIAQSLEAMGFGIVHCQPEHPDHPASAIVLAAANNAGKGINVSVPVEGEVMYDVDGYPKSTAAAVGGGAAAVCDEAEQVLNDMHAALEAEFGVKMGEVMWEGKDPNRILRKADQIPKSEQRQREA